MNIYFSQTNCLYLFNFSLSSTSLQFATTLPSSDLNPVFVTYLTFQRQQWNLYQMLYSVIICRSIIIFRILCLLADRIFLLLIIVSWHCSIKEQSISLLAATFSHELTLNYFFPLEQAWTCPWQDTILGLPLPGRFSKAFSEGYYIPSFEILTIETASKRHILP